MKKLLLTAAVLFILTSAIQAQNPYLDPRQPYNQPGYVPPGVVTYGNPYNNQRTTITGMPVAPGSGWTAPGTYVSPPESYVAPKREPSQANKANPAYLASPNFYGSSARVQGTNPLTGQPHNPYGTMVSPENSFDPNRSFQPPTNPTTRFTNSRGEHAGFATQNFYGGYNYTGPDGKPAGRSEATARGDLIYKDSGGRVTGYQTTNPVTGASTYKGTDGQKLKFVPSPSGTSATVYERGVPIGEVRRDAHGNTGFTPKVGPQVANPMHYVD